MSNSPNLALPYIDQNQSQKHVTHNVALLGLDAVVQLSVINDSLTAPPGSPSDGDRYLVATSATGVWLGKDGKIAAWQNGAWSFYTAKAGWLAWIASRSANYLFDGSSWVPLASVIGGASTLLSKAAHGGKTESFCDEELVTLSGATTNSTIVIPNGALVIAVSNRVVTAITGATSYSCGVSGNATQFGSGLSISAGSTNRGLIGPNPFYADTNVLFTAAGGNFSGGQVRMTIHYLKPMWATS